VWSQCWRGGSILFCFGHEGVCIRGSFLAAKNDRGGTRTHDQSSEVDSKRVLSTTSVVITFLTTPSRTVHAPFNAHGSPGIRLSTPGWRAIHYARCLRPIYPASLPRVSGITLII
jgi:hypothetical protein